MGTQKVRYRATLPHYWDHIKPIWNLLPDNIKAPKNEYSRSDIVIVAGYNDVPHGSPYIMVEHGAGFSWVDKDFAHYSGGSGHHDCMLFICPNQIVADRWMNRYPNTPVAVVGCPRLDKYVGVSPPSKTVAIAFHWDCKLLPETRSAWRHYQPGIKKMIDSYRSQGWEVIGHWHPRERRMGQQIWKGLKVEWTDDPLRDASVLIADATSLMAEMHALGRPVLGLNAPWYRRDVHHGMRFWEWPIPLVDGPKDAAGILLDTMVVPDGWEPYAYVDGLSGRHAANAILSLI